MIVMKTSIHQEIIRRLVNEKILYVWIALAIILVGGLTFIGVKVKSQNAPYTEIEKELVLQPKAIWANL